jgi:hypothetical protein
MSLSGPTLWGKLPFDILSRIIRESVGAKDCHKNTMNPVLSELLERTWRYDSEEWPDTFREIYEDLCAMLRTHIAERPPYGDLSADPEVALDEIMERIEISTDDDDLSILQYNSLDDNAWDIASDLLEFVWNLGFHDEDRHVAINELFLIIQMEHQ